MNTIYQKAIDETQHELDAIDHAIEQLNVRAKLLREYIEHTQQVMGRAPLAVSALNGDQ